MPRPACALRGGCSAETVLGRSGPVVVTAASFGATGREEVLKRTAVLRGAGSRKARPGDGGICWDSLERKSVVGSPPLRGVAWRTQQGPGSRETASLPPGPAPPSRQPHSGTGHTVDPGLQTPTGGLPPSAWESPLWWPRTLPVVSSRQCSRRERGRVAWPDAVTTEGSPPTSLRLTPPGEAERGQRMPDRLSILSVCESDRNPLPPWLPGTGSCRDMFPKQLPRRPWCPRAQEGTGRGSPGVASRGERRPGC